MDIKKQIAEIENEVIELRRDFHMHPELGFEEVRTSGKILEYLENIPDADFSIRHLAKTGVAATMTGGQSGPTLLIRADIDALPVVEENTVEYRSVNEGVMHACGHDSHAAMLLGAAKVLAGYKDQLKGNIKFVFQPNEENAGAEDMIKEGVMEDPKVDAALSTHIWATLESGKIGLTAGPVMALTENFKLTITGKQGHTANPHVAVDPIVVAADIVSATRNIAARETDPLHPIAVVFGKIHGGSAFNIIPDEVILEGTIRYLFAVPEGEPEPRDQFERIIKGICMAYGAQYDLFFEFRQVYVDNDPKIVSLVKESVEEALGKENCIEGVKTMIGEDFSEFGKLVPSVLFFTGTMNPEKGSDYPHHHPRFNVDEDTLKNGMEVFVRTALKFLGAQE